MNGQPDGLTLRMRDERPGLAPRWASAEAVLRHAVERFHPRLYVACSFQKEGSVLMDMLMRIQPETRFFTLDTGLFFPETYAVWRALEQRYDVRVDVYQGMSLARQAHEHGDALWERNPEACCGVRKIAPLHDALADVDCWVTGARREQSPLRAGIRKLGWDRRNGLWKANPLADWSEEDVFAYLEEHDVPYNELHRRGYGSIGCVHCTIPGRGRAGRWAGTAKSECGLHATA